MKIRKTMMKKETLNVILDWRRKAKKELHTPNEKLLELYEAKDKLKQTPLKTELESYYEKYKKGKLYKNPKHGMLPLKEIYFCHVHNKKYVILERKGKTNPKRTYDNFEEDNKR